MSASHTITETVNTGGRQLTKQNTFAADSAPNIYSASIPDSSTDLLVNIALDVDKVKSFYMVADQDITIETNDGATPDNTINLKAGVPYIWHENSYHSFLLTVDVTAFYVTNSSGQTATLDVEATMDCTPG